MKNYSALVLEAAQALLMLSRGRAAGISIKTKKKQPAAPPASPRHKKIPIGRGRTMISKKLYERVNWGSYTKATRTLLAVVFTRSILATHSLTGKKSPAFPNKPAKMCLDPIKVADIVTEIKRKFRVPENQIRSIITTKCADECKRLRMKKRKDAAAAGTSEGTSLRT